MNVRPIDTDQPAWDRVSSPLTSSAAGNASNVLLPDSVARSGGARADDLRSQGNHRLLDAAGLRTGDRVIRHLIAGDGIPLATSPKQALSIARGEHQVRSVDGVALQYPSQRLDLIESAKPLQRGQTHTLTKHVAQSLADNVRRITQEHVSGAGGFTDLDAAENAVDTVIADPPSQQALSDFLRDPSKQKFALPVMEFDSPIGTSTSKRDVMSGDPALVDADKALVVMIKDGTFPEGYRVLTAYPKT